MIFIHELGHFLAARWVGVEVEEFGFGLPSKKLVTLFTWQGTEFTIHALPLGGFVRPKGENDPAVNGGLAAASPWKRLAVLFAGPLMNLVTAYVVIALLIAFEGMPTPGPVTIASVYEGSPAYAAGLREGDTLLALNGEDITEVQPAIDIIKAHLDQPVEVALARGGQEMLVTATPSAQRDAAGEGALGIALQSATRPATFSEMALGSAAETGLRAFEIVSIPVQLVRGALEAEQARVVGFKGIFDMFNLAVTEDVSSRQKAAAEPAGAAQPTNFTLNLIGWLSVSLGVMNLLPIPALDGGRILFTLPEILFHRRIPPERENFVNGVAMLILIALMLFVNVMDFVDPAQIPQP